MSGALLKIQREREMVWYGAMLPYLDPRPDLDQFVGRQPDEDARIAAWHEAMDKMDRALARH